MTRQSIPADLLSELRSVHSGVHAALDMLLRQYDPTECGRILIVIDERLTGAINRLVAIAAVQAETPERPQPADGSELQSELAATVRSLHKTWLASEGPRLVDAGAEETGRSLAVALDDSGITVHSPGVAFPVGSIRVEIGATTTLHCNPTIDGDKAVRPDVRTLEEWSLKVVDRWRDVIRAAQKQLPTNADKEETAARRPLIGPSSEKMIDEPKK